MRPDDIAELGPILEDKRAEGEFSRWNIKIARNSNQVDADFLISLQQKHQKVTAELRKIAKTVEFSYISDDDYTRAKWRFIRVYGCFSSSPNIDAGRQTRLINAIFNDEEDLDSLLSTPENASDEGWLRWGVGKIRKGFKSIPYGGGLTIPTSDPGFLEELQRIQHSDSPLAIASKEVLRAACQGIHKKFERIAQEVSRQLLQILEVDLQARAKDSSARQRADIRQAALVKLSAGLKALDIDKSRLVLQAPILT